MAVSDQNFTFFLPDEDATEQLGVWFSERLTVGDCLLLSGPIGAGKSHFARAFIRARLDRMEDVPSPSFTLVQTYSADVDIWHADLYRLTHPDEIIELGLEDAFADAISLIEWPDRLGDLTPKDAVAMTFSAKDEGRQICITFSGRPGLAAALRQDWAQNE